MGILISISRLLGKFSNRLYVNHLAHSAFVQALAAIITIVQVRSGKWRGGFALIAVKDLPWSRKVFLHSV